MKYQGLSDLQEAYATGELDREKNPIVVDNDECYVYVGDEQVFHSGGPSELLFDALGLLDLPAEGA